MSLTSYINNILIFRGGTNNIIYISLYTYINNCILIKHLSYRGIGMILKNFKVSINFF